MSVNVKEIIPKKPPHPIVSVYARDWSSQDGPIPIDYPFRAYYSWISGMLIKEEEDYICIAQDYCPGTGNVREVWTIPKNTIIARFNYNVGDGAPYLLFNRMKGEAILGP